jgi:hypothetical protein
MVQGGACYNANANAADFHKASLNFHYPQFACMPGRVWKTQQTEWHSDVSALPQPIFVRAELAKVSPNSISPLLKQHTINPRAPVPRFCAIREIGEFKLLCSQVTKV